MIIWGLVMMKAKTGINAASANQKSETVQNSWQSVLKLFAVTALATYAQMRFDQPVTSVK